MIAYASAFDSRSSSTSVWLVKDGKATLLGPGADPEDASGEASGEPFAATVNKLLESDKGERFYISIQILTRADADKFAADKTAKSNGSDGSDGSDGVSRPGFPGMDDSDGDSSGDSDSSESPKNSSSTAEDPSPPTEEELPPP